VAIAAASVRAIVIDGSAIAASGAITIGPRPHYLRARGKHTGLREQ
jgi:hypothetical protein